MPRRRSIYETGAYETPLADLIEKIPDYFMQWEMLKQGEADKQEEKIYRAGRDFIADTKYQDKVTRDKQIYEDSIDQRDLKNEISLINMLPQHMRSNVMKTSDIDEISSLGIDYSAQEEAVQELIEPLKGGETIQYYDNLLTRPDIFNNPTAKKQVEAKRKNKIREVATAQINQYFVDNPDVYNIGDQKRILAKATTDPVDALKTMKAPKGEYTFASAVAYLRTQTARMDFGGDLSDLPQREKDVILADAQRILDQFTPSGKEKVRVERKGKKIAGEILKEHPWVKPGSDLFKKELNARMDGSSVIQDRTEQQYLAPKSVVDAVTAIEKKRLEPEGVTEEDLAKNIEDFAKEPIIELEPGLSEKEKRDLGVPAVLGDLQAGTVPAVSADTTVTVPLPLLSTAPPPPDDIVTVPVDTTTVQPTVIPVLPKDEFVGVEETSRSGLKTKDGKFKNVEGVSSIVSDSIETIERMKPIYGETADGTEKKRLLLSRIAAEQQKIINLIEPYISKKTGNFKNKDFNKTFYNRLSKKTKIPESKLKELILNNLQYSLL